MMKNRNVAPQDKPATRTERQRQRTRRQLLDAGRSLIAAKGVAGLRIQEITETADVALGSFYNYFESKDEFLEAIMTESLTELAAATVATEDLSSDPADVVALASLRVVGVAYTEPEFARLIANIGHSEALFGRALHPYAREAVERGIDSGRFVVPNIDVLLTAVIGAAFALIREILDGRHGPHAERAFAQYMLAALGLTPDEAATVVAKVAASEQA
ncbi:TetR/AcrR family transcriptional regulator [Mycolicibacterium fluoranthenivorans]|uniref:AcrR family transcriptional regulator n=1 Tax=Mycolicibacterium fluoranthenivorans TaxID=258505 RepID=A0A7X5U5Z8_9MYCO|nr:TetR/AcrR family transcriptional regulator [Mycolicibacterium fluoranthenivorans]NIH99080.1 AcrR family transcriptional regulator [Mycolicibacterium fluoranthenivorans]